MSSNSPQQGVRGKRLLANPGAQKVVICSSTLVHFNPFFFLYVLIVISWPFSSL